MRGKILTLLATTLFVAGCADDTEQGMSGTTNPDQIQPINYETPKEQQERVGQQEKSVGELGGYPQNEQEFVNEGDKNVNAKNEDRYTNEKTLQISEYLSERKEIVQAQVAETDDRIIIAVQTENHEYHDLNRIIEEEVRRIEPEKQIVVYTDDNYWERMRNLNSRQIKLEDDIENSLREFFNND